MNELQNAKKFKGRIVRTIWTNDTDFWVYAVEIDHDKYPYIARTKYGNVSISGNLGTLATNIIYEITAIPTNDKYGITYSVVNMRRDIPTSEYDVLMFLQEILTESQAEVLYANYPDIIDRVRENRLDDIDLSKTKGIKQKTFNIIVEKISENFCLADLVVEFQGHLSMNILKKIYEKYRTIEAVKHALNIDPYKCLCSLAGVGYKTADSILLNLEKVSKTNIENGKEPIINFSGDLKSSRQRLTAFIVYKLQENENEGHTKMNLIDMRKLCLINVPETIEHFADAISDEQIYYSKEDLDIALYYTHRAEEYIATTILNVVNSNHIKDDKYDIAEWDYDIEKYRQVNGFELSDEQMSIIKNVCDNQINILNGSAGVGKTASTQAIIQMLREHNHTFLLLSPTGKASKVLAEYTGCPAKTIHRGLGYMPPHNWSYNQDNKLPYDIIVVDEFSMVDVFLFQQLLKAIDFDKTRLLLIGDNAQLPSVQCGNLLHDFMTSKIIPTVTLSKVFRYGEGGLMKVATDVRMCKRYLGSQHKGKVTQFGNNKDYVYIDVEGNNLPRQVVALYRKLLAQGYTPEDMQVLSAKNIGAFGTIKLNKYIQRVANPPQYYNDFNDLIEKPHITYGRDETQITYYVDDLVIQIQNNYHAKVVTPQGDTSYNELTNKPQEAFIANGETGRITYVGNNYLIINFDDVYVKYTKDSLKQINLGYSISIHKSQGSTIKIPILITTSSDVYMLNSNLLYVGLTRMKDKCFHFGTVDSVNRAVVKKANLTRNTFMVDLLTKSSTKQEKENSEQSES